MTQVTLYSFVTITIRSRQRRRSHITESLGGNRLAGRLKRSLVHCTSLAWLLGVRTTSILVQFAWRTDQFQCFFQRGNQNVSWESNLSATLLCWMDHSTWSLFSISESEQKLFTFSLFCYLLVPPDPYGNKRLHFKIHLNKLCNIVWDCADSSRHYNILFKCP